MNNSLRYYHDDGYHGFSSPEVIVPLLIELLSPQSVVDIGCGTGNFLAVFKKNGVKKLLGIDGKWARKDLIFRYLSEQEFMEADIEKSILIDYKFDLALCLEVAEHIQEQYADNLIANLCKLSDIVIFSAAIPSQGGQNHVNEQWPSYWEKKFEIHDYEFIDCLRPVFWNNTNIDFWYRQNILIAARKTLNLRSQKRFHAYHGPVMDLVHPEVYGHKTSTINKFYSGNLKLYYKAAMRLIQKKLHL